jgi:hypothetical protein
VITLVIPSARTIILADSLTSTTTVTNTAVETPLYSTTFPANSLKVGSHLELNLQGLFSSVASNNGIATFRFYINSTLLGSLTSVPNNRSLSPCQIFAQLTCRSIGLTGSVVTFLEWDEGTHKNMASGSVIPLDTTIAHSGSVTVQYATASVDNTISIEQGSLLVSSF